MNTNDFADNSVVLDIVPAGVFRGGDSVPPGSFHGGDEVPGGTFHS